MTDSDAKIIVGSQEWCGFPDLGVPAIMARVDSGAKTSSIHAFNIQPFKRHGESWVSFEVHPLQGNRRTTMLCESRVIDRRLIRSSSGIAEKRYVISTSFSRQNMTVPQSGTRQASCKHAPSARPHWPQGIRQHSSLMVTHSIFPDEHCIYRKDITNNNIVNG